MVNPAVAAGTVVSNTTSAITLQSALPALTATTAYYLEVTAGPGEAPWVGERFEVSVAGSSGVTVAIDTTSPRNTRALTGVDLAGYNVKIRPHMTLAQVFPPALIAAGDQILAFNRVTGGFYVYTRLVAVGPLPNRWDRGGNQNSRVIAPGEGLFFRNRGTVGVELFTNMGEVRTNEARQPLAAGLNHVAQLHPVDSSPASRLMTGDNGFIAAAVDGDQIHTFDPVGGGFATISYLPAVGPLPIRWMRGTDNVTATELFGAGGSFFVRKRRAADPNHTVPPPLIN